MSRSSGLAFTRCCYPKESKTGDSQGQAPSGAQRLATGLHQIAQGLNHPTFPFGSRPDGRQGGSAIPIEGEGHALGGHEHPDR